ncbi:MAG TPA: GNAT family N-acetyltransferase [Clostridia bacterium]
MRIECAAQEDLKALLDLQKLAYQSEAELCNDYTIPPLTQTYESICEDFSNMDILKAVDENDNIIGSVRACEKEGVCHIGRLFVHPDYQNMGIGRLLMQEIEKRFSYCIKYALFTGKHSIKNLYFYQKMGYKIVGEEQLNDKVIIVNLEKTR